MYQIKITWHYYAGNMPRNKQKYILDFSGQPLTFDTKAEAEGYIQLCESSIYRLDNGEYSRPDLKTVEVTQ